MAFFEHERFWAALSGIVALLALVLSQLPPVSKLLIGRRVELRLAQNVDINHYLGLVQLRASVGIYNSGAHVAHIARVECLLRLRGDDGQVTVRRLRGLSYVLPDAQAQNAASPEVPFVLTTVLPEQSWTVGMAFFPPMTEDDDRIVQALQSDFSWSIWRERQRGGVNDPSVLVEVEREIVERAEALLERRFFLAPGDLEIVISLHDVDDRLLDVAGIKTQLSAPDLGNLRDVRQGYRYGFGVTSWSMDPKHRLRKWTQAIDDDTARRLYRELTRELALNDRQTPGRVAP